MPKQKSMSLLENHEPSEAQTLPPLSPIIEGLLARLPEEGAVWPKPERQKWIALLQGTIDLIYKDEPPKTDAKA